MTKTFVRQFRLLEYYGPEEWLRDAIERRGVKGRISLPDGAYIAEGLIGETPTAAPEPSDVERMRDALRSLHFHLTEGTVNREVFVGIVESALRAKAS